MVVTTPSSEATKAQILSAAERVFGELGYRSATIGAVADEAGVSRPLIYRYFGDKAGLYSAAVRRVLDEWHAFLVERADLPTPSTAHRIRQILVGCLEFVRERSVVGGLLATDSTEAHRAAGPAMLEGRNMLPRLVARVLREGTDRGDIRADIAAEEMAFVISEAFIACTLPLLLGHDDADSPARVDAIVETLVHGVVA